MLTIQGAASAADAYEKSSDRGSIKFLLNAGTDSFTEQFLLPPRSDRARGLEYHNQVGLKGIGPSGTHSQSTSAPAYANTDGGMAFFQDTFVSFFNGPFGEFHKSMDDPYTGGLAYQSLIPGQDPNLTLPGDQLPYEPERPFATALVHSILTRAWAVPLDPKSQQEISTNLNYLLTTARVRKFIALYFKYWHPSSPIIHYPSFDPETVCLPLLASVVFMGAMYSDDELEVHVAKRVLDFTELYVFSNYPFACEYEIGSTFCGNRNYGDSVNDWDEFQNFQAGFLILLVQYWAGGTSSKNRAMETRFSEVVQVCSALLHSWHG